MQEEESVRELKKEIVSLRRDLDKSEELVEKINERLVIDGREIIRLNGLLRVAHTERNDALDRVRDCNKSISELRKIKRWMRKVIQ